MGKRSASREGRAWLEEVGVRDLALLEGVTLTLSRGLNVLSGETGEGKSLLLTAISLLLGARARKGLVRSGAREAAVEGRFRLHGVDLSEVTDLVSSDAEEVCLRRVVTAEGTSRAYLDGSLVPVGLLARLGERLVDVHGQRHSLLRPADQRVVLDRFAGCDDLVEQWRSGFLALEDVRERLESLRAEEAGRAERLEFLRFQVRELVEAAPEVGEEAELVSRLKILGASTELDRVLQETVSDLGEGDRAFADSCARLARRLEETGAADAGVLGTIVERLRALAIEAEDLARECGHERHGIESDPRALSEAEERLSLLRQLARRHRVEPDDLAARREALEAEIAELGGDGDPEEALREQQEELVASLRQIGAALWKARRAGARKLERTIKPALKELKMDRARVRVDVQPATWPDDHDPTTGSVDGPGPVGFLVAANPGEPEQPIEQVASGGELARILLALKGALAGAHRIPLLIFDEIDAGVGGRVGMPFGRRIASIAEHHQVLVVTHLPQVAAFAERHLGVRKEVASGRTRTEVFVLDDTARERELAAMLGGGDAGEAAEDAARLQARALIEEAAS